MTNRNTVTNDLMTSK